MTTKTRATETVPADMTLEKALAMIAELTAKMEGKDQALEVQAKKIEEIEKKEEGWLVWTNNALYSQTTAGVLFTDGCAFIPKTRVYPRFKVELPAEDQLASMKPKDAEIVKASVAMLSSERLVKYLVNDFGYHAQFFDKDHMDELQQKISDRARERMEAQARINPQKEQMEKLLNRYHL